MVDSHRDLLGNSMDAYMSMMSRRQNDAMKQLTIIATVFLPLSFLTGFFGQNFGWLVEQHRLRGGLLRHRHRDRGRGRDRPVHPVQTAWLALGRVPRPAPAPRPRCRLARPPLRGR